MFVVGETYSRRDISAQVGGDPVSFLPFKDGRVVAACLTPKQNPKAPYVILVGHGIRREEAGRLLGSQTAPIPVFIKMGRNLWEYQGEFRSLRTTESQEEIGSLAPPNKRKGAYTLAIFMEDAKKGHGVSRKNWEHASGVLWPFLTKAAKAKRLLNYQECAEVIGTNPLSVRFALDPIQQYCIEYRLPPLTSIVGQKNSGVPGKGFIAWDIDDLNAAHEAVFQANWDRLENPYGRFGEADSTNEFAKRLIENPNIAKDIYSIVRVRGIIQKIFREAVFKAYEGVCAFCGLSFRSALEAAHIKGWTECSPEERLDPRNGILLCASHHRLFDSGDMWITSNHRIFYCDAAESEGSYSEADRALSVELHNKELRLPKNKMVWPSPQFIAARNEEDAEEG